MSTDTVLSAAADNFERREEFRVDRELQAGAGSSIFCLLYETAKQLYGWAAVEQLQRHLRDVLPGGQLQHWAETDRAAVVQALRQAAAAPVPADLETVALRAKLSEFHGLLQDALGAEVAETATLVTSIGEELARARKEATRLARELAEERRHHNITTQMSRAWKVENDKLRRQLGMAPPEQPPVFPPVRAGGRG